MVYLQHSPDILKETSATTELKSKRGKKKEPKSKYKCAAPPMPGREDMFGRMRWIQTYGANGCGTGMH